MRECACVSVCGWDAGRKWELGCACGGCFVSWIVCGWVGVLGTIMVVFSKTLDSTKWSSKLVGGWWFE